MVRGVPCLCVACVAMCRGKSMQNVASAHLRYWGCQESPAPAQGIICKEYFPRFLVVGYWWQGWHWLSQWYRLVGMMTQTLTGPWPGPGLCTLARLVPAPNLELSYNSSRLPRIARIVPATTSKNLSLCRNEFPTILIKRWSEKLKYF